MEYSEDDLLDIINGITGSGDETGNDQTDTGSKIPDGADITSTDSPEGQTTEKNDVIEPRNENEDDTKIHENKKSNLLNNLNDKFDDIDRMLDVSLKTCLRSRLNPRVLEVFIRRQDKVNLCSSQINQSDIASPQPKNEI